MARASAVPGAQTESNLLLDRGTQRKVDAYFEVRAPFWEQIYDLGDVYSVIHQRRRARALSWVDRLALPPTPRVLEVGCGAGPIAVAFTQRGLVVDATDSDVAMVGLARRHAGEARVSGQLRAMLADAHALPFRDAAFRLVIALGVIPWLHSPRTAIREMARVLQPGGYLIMNADNRGRLNVLLDPLYSPALTPLRRSAKHLLRRAATGRPAVDELHITMHSLREFYHLLGSAGLETLAGETYGFGPFTLFGRTARLAQGRAGVSLHRLLQGLADCEVPGLRSRGAQYLVLARKPAPS
jgi:ubiquinone/menaquinone biosynthesis C-methylase UbiE